MDMEIFQNEKNAISFFLFCRIRLTSWTHLNWAQTPQRYRIYFRTFIKSQRNVASSQVLENPSHTYMSVHLNAILNVKCISTAVFWDAVSLLEKAVSTLQEKRNLTKQLRILPILTNVLDKVTSHNHNKIDHVLKLIQDITFDITVKSPEPYLELLFELLVKFVISEHTDVSFFHDLTI